LSATDEAARSRQVAPALLAWWQQHGRHDLPWQRPPDPWRIWVSEIMLQQTQVSTVLNYYPRFIERFPDPVTLADAPLDEVLHLWSGLGYYARARNLHRAATIVRDDHAGRVPADFTTLAALPGIGRSTAGAVLALAHGQPWPILDGNARRVLCRLFAVRGWPQSTAVSARLWTLAAQCTPADAAAPYTQAIMDLGATLCTRQRPACARCPLAAFCAARELGISAELPERRPRRARARRATVMLMLVREQDGAVLLERRPEQGVWGGLWAFPEAPALDGLADWCLAKLGARPGKLSTHPVVAHAFTHFDLAITPVEARIAAVPARVMESGRWLWYKTRTPAKIGLAAPVTQLLAVLGDQTCPTP